MDEKLIKNLVKNSVKIKVAQAKNQNSVPETINLGSGTPVFKQALPGESFGAVVSRPLTEDVVLNTIMESLQSLKVHPSQQYTPDQQNYIIKKVIGDLQNKYSKYLDILNPAIGNVTL
jgi:hypothetical protein